MAKSDALGMLRSCFMISAHFTPKFGRIAETVFADELDDDDDDDDVDDDDDDDVDADGLFFALLAWEALLPFDLFVSASPEE